jgi:hypothetical protein
MVGSIDPRCETIRGTHWPKPGRVVVWNSRRGNHLGQRFKPTASTGRTYGCKRSDQTRKNSCGTGAVHIWVPAQGRDDTDDGQSDSTISDSIVKQPDVIASGAKQSIEPQRKYGLLRRGACHRARIRATRWLLAMTVGYTSAFPRRDAPGLCMYLSPKNEGVGNAGRTVHPQASCARVESRKHTSSTVAPESPGIPARNGFNGFLRAPRRPGLFATVISGVASADLTPASGRQDHTALPYATRLRLSLRRAWYPSAETPAKAETAPFVRTLGAAEGEHIACLTPPRPSHPAPRR